MIYEQNNQYYLKQNDKYYLAEIIIKSNTIVISPTDKYVIELENSVEVDYKEVKSRYIKEESTENVGSLNSSEV